MVNASISGIIKFEELAKAAAEVPETTVRACSLLDTAIETLRVNFEEGRSVSPPCFVG